MTKLRERQKNLSPLQVGREILMKMVFRAHKVLTVEELRDFYPGYEIERLHKMHASDLEDVGLEVIKKTEELTSLNMMQDGHLTTAVTNMGHLGWAKFNPNDKKKWLEMKKGGKVVKREASRYSTVAGQRLAIHRAVKKFFEHGA